MNVVEFLRRKNEIVKKTTGVILVPESQIMDIPEDKRTPLECYGLGELSEYDYLGADFCPYCALYFDNEDMYFGEKCEGCPMHEAGNSCGQDKDNTWAKANNTWIKKSTRVDWKKLRDLVVEYNKQFENSRLKE